MRWVALTTAAAVLAGCGMSDLAKRPDNLSKAVAAYRAGDISGLQALEDEADGIAVAELAAKDGDDPCTDQGMKAVKAVAVSYIIGKINNATVVSMSPEARYLYLQHLAQGGITKSEVPATIRVCKDDQNSLRAMRDIMSAMSVAHVMASGMERWDVDLEAQYGSEYRPRMAAAQMTLARNGVLGRDAEIMWATRRIR